MVEEEGVVLFVAVAHVVDMETQVVWDAMAIMAAMAITAAWHKVQLNLIFKKKKRNQLLQGNLSISPSVG